MTPLTAKRVAVFTCGIPDPSQGGSGIFNYYVIRELLARGCEVTAFFRAGEAYLNHHTVDNYLAEFASRGLSYQIIVEQPATRRRLAFGLPLLLKSHQVETCNAVVNGMLREGVSFDAYIAHDLGWIIALAGKVKPLVGLLGDPFRGRVRYGKDLSLFSPRSWVLRLQALSAGSKKTIGALARLLNGQLVLGSFTPHHALEYRAGGLDCAHFRWFSPEVTPSGGTGRKCEKINSFRLLHIGTLASTASTKMLEYWMGALLPELATLPFTIEIRFVGRSGKPFDSRWDNIRLVFLGHENTLDKEFNECDAFFSPMKYPVGTRTRILTALSHGMPVIADSSASLGLPELEDGKDILYGDNPGDIKRIVSRLYADEESRTAVGARAREKWEKFFQPKPNVSAILAAVGL